MVLVSHADNLKAHTNKRPSEKGQVAQTWVQVTSKTKQGMARKAIRSLTTRVRAQREGLGYGHNPIA